MDDEPHPVSQEWLKTEEGRWWLQSDDGMTWLNSTEGRWWQQGDDGRSWMEELAQDGWAAYFAGKSWPTPTGFIIPEAAPPLRSRVILTEERKTFSGEVFEAGDVGLVVSLQLNPIGTVNVELRMEDDARRCLLTLADGFRLLSDPPE